MQVHYVYDAWNRLVAVYADDSGEPGDLMAQYEYDGFNQRIVKTVYDGEDTTTSEYFYNESWQLLAARTTAGEDTSATHYVWDLSYVDAPITQLVDANADGDFNDAGDATYYYTFDANQNVTALLGLVETAPDVFEWQVIERYTYTPYGVATAHDADWSNPAAPTTDGPLYAGYHFDTETGLYHVRNRQYDPSLGAFTTRDPIGYAAGDENLYRYVGNNPVGAADPVGLEMLPWNTVITRGNQWWPGSEQRVMGALAYTDQQARIRAAATARAFAMIPGSATGGMGQSFWSLPDSFGGISPEDIPKPVRHVYVDPNDANITYGFVEGESTACVCYQGKRVVAIKLQYGILHDMQEVGAQNAAAARANGTFSGWLTSVHTTASLAVAGAIAPESDPNIVLTFEDGETLTLLGGGPSSAAMLGQAGFIYGAAAAAGERGLIGVGKEFVTEYIESQLPGISLIPLRGRPRGGPLDATFNARNTPSIGRHTGGDFFTGSADEAYDAIRASSGDVNAIAQNTGIKPQNIQKVKDHVFYNEHLLDRYVDYGEPAVMGRFDSDLGQANAWKRLESGTHTPADLQFLRHEAAEAHLMQRWNDPSYTRAHNRAQQRYPMSVSFLED